MELQTFSKTAVVENVEGRVFYVDANGAQIFVKSGDLIPAGSVVVSLSGAQYEIHSSGGQFRVAGQCATCDDDNRGFVAKTLTSDDEIARLQDAILAGADPTEDFEAPAAGLGVSSTNAGFVEIERLNSQTIADAGFDTNNNFADGYDSELKDLGSSDEDALAFSITLNGPITADNIINDAETAQMITITGSVSDSVKPGTQVIVTVGDQTYTATVDENGNFSVDVPGSQLAQDTEVSAELATDSDVKDTISYEVDTDISVPTVSLNPDSNSGDKDDQTTNVTQPSLDIGNVDDDVVHVEVTLTGPSGTITGEAVETENGWEFIPSEPLEDGEYDVTITVTDGAGNTASNELDDPLIIDTVATPPTITFEDPGSDGIYNQAELGPDGTVTATVTLPDDFDPAKDKLVINGVEHTLTDDEIAAGKVDIQVTPNETVDAQITDAAGNTSDLASETAPDADITCPAPSVELIGDTNGDGVFNIDEIGPDGTITAEVTLAPGTEVGDRIIVKDADGNVLLDKTVTQDDLDNGIHVEVPVGSGTQVGVTAQITDPAGNVSPEVSDSVGIDNVAAPAPSVSLLGDTNGDGVYNIEELGADGTVTAEVTLASGTEVGDRIIIKDTDGSVLVDREITQADLDNGIQVEVSVVGNNVEVTAQVVDAAGNPSPEASDNALVDTDAASAPTVELQGDTNDDGVYNSDELGADGTVTAKVTLAADTVVGDTISITDGAGNIILEREVTQDDLDNGILVEVPPYGDRVDVTAQVTDPAGNKSPEASDSALVDTDAASAPTVELQGDTSGDGVYNSDELGTDGTVTAKVTLAADTAVGDIITITDGAGNVIFEREVTQDDLDNGIFVEVPPYGDRVDVTAQVTDPAGNKSPEASDSALVDTDAAPAPSVELLGDTNGDGVYNSDELGADGTVTAEVTLA
ncbi:retention module-containing protein, partial [Photobacterium aphoticum]